MKRWCLVVVTLMASLGASSCSGGGTAANPAQAPTSAAAVASGPATEPPSAALIGACRRYNEGYANIGGLEGLKAGGDLGDSMAGDPIPALTKLKPLIEAHIVKVEEAKAMTTDPELVAAFDFEISAAKAIVDTIANKLSGKSKLNGQTLFQIWTLYQLHAGDRVVKLCPPSLIEGYAELGDLRRQFG